MMDLPDVYAAKAWKSKSLRIAHGLLQDRNGRGPISSHQLDQILATIRDAGMSEREQGVFLVGMLHAELSKRGWSPKVQPENRMVIATALAMHLLAKPK